MFAFIYYFLLSGLIFITFLSCAKMGTGGEIDNLKIVVNLNKPIASSETVQKLLRGVGDDYSHNDLLIDRLKKLGINQVRLVNVDLADTKFLNGRIETPLLDKALAWCRRLNAQPHIIIGQGIPTGLSSHGIDFNYGPKDWRAYQEYLRLYFEHVILEKGFTKATWEVANEPDIRGAPYPTFPRPPRPLASEEDYQAYWQLYRQIAAVATQFEQAHPGVKIVLGGPAITAGASYRFSKFNWFERFLRDVAQERVKIDFFSFHFYGNRAALGNRENRTPIPPFNKIMENLHSWIEQYKPGLPIWITEWGPSSHVKEIPAAIINANHVGAAWGAAFVDSLFKHGVSKAFFLLIADIRHEWTWPALFHGNDPKPIFFVLDFFSQLKGDLFQVRGGTTAVGAMAAGEPDHLQIVLWNYDWQRGDDDGGSEGASQAHATIQVSGLPGPQKVYQVRSSLISKESGNPYYHSTTGGAASKEPLTNYLGTRRQQGDVLKLTVTLPPSSVTFLSINSIKD